MKKNSTYLILLFVILAFSQNSSYAQWPANTATNVAVDNTAGYDHWQGFWYWDRTLTTTDGNGGIITTWYDGGSGPFSIFAARIDKNGTKVWTKTVCQPFGLRFRGHPTITSDGSGGAIIAWEDWRDSTAFHTQDIYAARLDANGNFVWGASNGLPIVANGYGNAYRPQICSDGAGGAIVVWNPDVAFMQVYAQHISAAGSLTWPGTYGLAVVDSINRNHMDPAITADGLGGAIIAWQDDTKSTVDPDIYAKRINVNGNTVWGGRLGIPVCDTIGAQSIPVIVSDGSGGAVIAWLDARSGGQWVYSQRVNGAGNMMWTKNGSRISSATAADLKIASNGGGGAYLTWDAGSDIYIQMVNGAGNIKWAANGLNICNAAGVQWYPDIVSTRNGQAIIAWGDYRGGTYSDVYAQLIDSSATAVQWTANGNVITTANCSQGASRVMVVPDGCNGAIITFMDRRNSPGCATTHNDIYAQNINSDGTIGGISGTVGCLTIPPHAQFQASDSTICAFDCINFTDLSTNIPNYWSWTFAGGTPPTSNLQNPFVCYLDSNGGTFSVKLVVANNGGRDSATYNALIHIYPSPPVPQITQSGDSLICSFNPSYVKYQWSKDTTIIPSGTGPRIKVTSSGNYNLQVTNADSCSIAAGINITVGMEGYNADNSFGLSPNPATGSIYIYTKKTGDVRLTVYDLLGDKLIEERSRLVNMMPVNIQMLPSGVYFINIRSEQNDDINWIGKFVKEE